VLSFEVKATTRIFRTAESDRAHWTEAGTATGRPESGRAAQPVGAPVIEALYRIMVAAQLLPGRDNCQVWLRYPTEAPGNAAFQKKRRSASSETICIVADTASEDS
jgi:hypothetical protein